jgi:hypothetical protein
MTLMTHGSVLLAAHSVDAFRNAVVVITRHSAGAQGVTASSCCTFAGRIIRLADSYARDRVDDSTGTSDTGDRCGLRRQRGAAVVPETLIAEVRPDLSRTQRSVARDG